MKDIDRLLIFASYGKVPILILEYGSAPVPHYLEGVDFYTLQVLAERVSYEPNRIVLHLKDVENIEEEHLYDLSNIEGWDLGDNYDLKKDRLLSVCKGRGHYTLSYRGWQYLIKNEYAMPWNNMDVQELVNNGIYKLR